MNATIKFWVDYIGGMDIVWLAIAVLVTTQVAKPVLLKIGDGLAVRLFAGTFGAIVGAFKLPPVDHGVLIGWAVGGATAFLWFVVATRLKTGSWKDAGPTIAARMLNKDGNGG